MPLRFSTQLLRVAPPAIAAAFIASNHSKFWLQNDQLTHCNPSTFTKQKEWLRQNNPAGISPESRLYQTDDLSNFENIRANIREKTLDCLINKEYHQYRALTNRNHLPSSAFSELVTLIDSLSETEKNVLRVTCWLVKTTQGDTALQNYGHTPPKDSEEWLTYVATLAAKGEKTGIPLVDQLSSSEKNILLKAFCGAHLRHILFCEGSLKMFEHIPKDESNFNIWQARWWLNLVAFQGNEGYLDDNLYQMTRNIMTKAQAIRQATTEEATQIWGSFISEFGKPKTTNNHPVVASHNFFTTHIEEEQTSLKSEETVIGTICMMANALSNEKKTQVADGIDFAEAINSRHYSQAVERIANYTLSDSPTKYTYIPAVIHSANTYLSKHPELENQLKSEFSKHEIPYSHIAAATAYTFSVFSDTLHAHHRDDVANVISLRDIAYIPNMEKQKHIEVWLENRMTCNRANQEATSPSPKRITP